MNSPSQEGVILKAMAAEMDQLAEMDAFKVVPHKKAIEEEKQIIDWTWTFKQKQYPGKDSLIKAMPPEMDQLAEIDAFKVVPYQKAIDKGNEIIDCTWVFKQKAYTNVTVKKLKARLCFCGDLQEIIVDVSDAYSPVVQWSTIPLLMILPIILKLETKQVD